MALEGDILPYMPTGDPVSKRPNQQGACPILGCDSSQRRDQTTPFLDKLSLPWAFCYSPNMLAETMPAATPSCHIYRILERGDLADLGPMRVGRGGDLQATLNSAKPGWGPLVPLCLQVTTGCFAALRQPLPAALGF